MKCSFIDGKTMRLSCNAEATRCIGGAILCESHSQQLMNGIRQQKVKNYMDSIPKPQSPYGSKPNHLNLKGMDAGMNFNRQTWKKVND